MRSDFASTNIELCQIGIVNVCRDTYMQPKRRGANYFVKSPVSTDKTWSLCLYPSDNRYCDFSNGNRSGDIISLYSYTQGCNNWQALKELQAYYGLADSRDRNKKEAQRRIQLQQEQERRKAERRQTFYRALRGEIDDLKWWAVIYRTSIEKRLYAPFTDEWAYCFNELQKTEYRLDILTGTDCKTYPRMKAYHENLPSDRYQWLLDVLAVLVDGGAFTATEEELKEIRAQAAFGVRRNSGTERRCEFEW